MQMNNNYIIGIGVFLVLFIISILRIKNTEEGFTSSKLKNMKKSYFSDEMREKLNKKRRKSKTLKEKFEEEKAEEEKFKTIGGSDIKYECIDYYNSFKKGPLGKKSNSTKESIQKLKILKEKFLEIF